MLKNKVDLDLTVPVRPDDFIHIQVHYLINILRRQENKAPDYRIEDEYKERVISDLYASKAQPFKSVEQQLGKFFQPIINELIRFRDEVLIDFEGVVKDDSKKLSK
jgi:hypothetical protein